jgi:hypothetical protein
MPYSPTTLCRRQYEQGLLLTATLTAHSTSHCSTIPHFMAIYENFHTSNLSALRTYVWFVPRDHRIREWVAPLMYVSRNYRPQIISTDRAKIHKFIPLREWKLRENVQCTNYSATSHFDVHILPT